MINHIGVASHRSFASGIVKIYGLKKMEMFKYIYIYSSFGRVSDFFQDATTKSPTFDSVFYLHFQYVNF